MPRLPMHPSSGTGISSRWIKSIRFVRYGCTNRPFYHIILIETKKKQRGIPIEQLGTYDPLPNMHNEKLASFNFERILYWLGQGGVSLSRPVAHLLGLCGFLPIYPKTYIKAWRKRQDTENICAKKGGNQEKSQIQEASTL